MLAPEPFRGMEYFAELMDFSIVLSRQGCNLPPAGYLKPPYGKERVEVFL